MLTVILPHSLACLMLIGDSMLNIILNIIFQAAVGPFLGFSLEKMLTVNNGVSKRWLRVSAWSFAWLLMAVMRIAFVGNDFMLVASYVILAIELIVFLRFFYVDPVWKKIIAPVSLLICTVVSDFIVQIAIFGIFDGVKLTLDYSSPYMLFASFFVTLLTILIYFITSIIWSKVFKRNLVLNHPIVFIILVGAEVASLLPSIIMFFRDGSQYLFEYNILIVSALIMTFSLAYILFDQSEKDVIQNDLNEIKQVMEIEQEHYARIENCREEMSKIRHDYNNFISSAIYLIRSGKTLEATEFLKELAVKVESTNDKD